MSAASVLALTTAAKICVVCFAIGYMGDTPSAVTVFGVVLAISGNVIYMLSRLYTMHGQELIETKQSDEGTDIVNNIVAKSEVAEASELADKPRPWWDFLGGGSRSGDGSTVEAGDGAGAAGSGNLS